MDADPERCRSPDRETLPRTKTEILCGACKTVYTSKKSYHRHCQGKHPDSPVIYGCPLCHNQTGVYQHFRCHYYGHLVRNRFKCDICGKAFSQNGLLKEHMEIVHENPYSCEICDKTFFTRAGLKLHSTNYHSETKISYECNQCGKILHSQNGFTIHMTTHKLGRSFMCDLCGTRFTQKINLKIHIQRYHTEKKLPCEVCQKMFLDVRTLELHRADHLSIKRFRCKICDKSFKTERYMRKHFTKHNNTTESNLCHVCNKGYSSATKLREHMNIHSGDKPFKCRFCAASFTNSPNRIKHMKRSHQFQSDGRGQTPFKQIPESGDVPKDFDGNSVRPQPISEPPQGSYLRQDETIENNLGRIDYDIDYSFDPIYQTQTIMTDKLSYSQLFSPTERYDIFVDDDLNIYCNDPTSNMSAALREQELELSDSYIREQMNGCDLNNLIPI